jgi:hypothetical protein
VNFALQKVTDINFGSQLADFCQIAVFQILDNNIINENAQIGRDNQSPNFDVGSCFFRKETSRKTHRKILNDRVLDGNEKARDDGYQHHKND